MQVKREETPWSPTVDMSRPTPWAPVKPEPGIEPAREPAQVKPEPGGRPPSRKGTPLMEPETEDERGRRRAEQLLAIARAHPRAPAGPVAQERVTPRNYDAVEARGRFGLIGRGVAQAGVREVLAHTPHGGGPLERLRPGETIRVLSPAGGPQETLRIRFTTPAGYCAPGRRVTALCLGVDEREWVRVARRGVYKPGPGRRAE